MKLKINFIFGAERRRELALYILWALTGLCLCFVIYFVLSGTFMRSGMAANNKKLDAIKAEYSAMPAPGSGPDAHGLAVLQSKVSEINRLKMGRSAGATRILSVLEKTTMDGIYFTGFIYNLEDNTVQIEARTGSAEKISAFMAALEKEPLFRQVSLEKQSQRESSSGLKAVDFSVKAVENTP